MNVWEIIATILGVIGVWLMIRQHMATWPVGIVQVAIFAWVCYGAKLYSDAILQVFYFAIQIYGWWHWLRVRGITRAELPVTRSSPRALAAWIVAGAAGTVAWGEMMRRTTDAAYPHWDAFVLVFSLIAQWLQAQKRIENWVAWIIVDAVEVGVFWAKDLRLFAGLYVVFLGMAVAGHLAWRRTMSASETTVAHG
jgi:nicotinamide mononucleotide transporter